MTSLGVSCPERPVAARRRRLARGVLGFTVIALIAVAAGCGDDGSSGGDGDLSVTLSEWKVKLDRASVSAGSVKIDAKNAGTIEHELLVVRSDVAAGGLPVVDGRVPEDKIDVIDEIPEFKAGAKASGTFELTAGRYLLLCNLPAHYQQGMVAELTVTG